MTIEQNCSYLLSLYFTVFFITKVNVTRVWNNSAAELQLNNDPHPSCMLSLCLGWGWGFGNCSVWLWSLSFSINQRLGLMNEWMNECSYFWLRVGWPSDNHWSSTSGRFRGKDTECVCCCSTFCWTLGRSSSAEGPPHLLCTVELFWNASEKKSWETKRLTVWSLSTDGKSQERVEWRMEFRVLEYSWMMYSKA